MLGALLALLSPSIVGAIIFFLVGSALGVWAELRRERQRREERELRAVYARARYRRPERVL